MSPEYPYQLVSFLDNLPAIGEGVYQGPNGWYPQITLKRRFTALGMSEDELLLAISNFAHTIAPLPLETGQLMKPDSMPVRVVEIINKDEIKKFHLKFINYMGVHMQSRYPERDGENYLPHITAEYDGKDVINANKFIFKSFVINKICLIKDRGDTDSHVVAYFDLENLS